MWWSLFRSNRVWFKNWGTVLKQTLHGGKVWFSARGPTLNRLFWVIFLKKIQKVWLSSSREIWSQTRCAILPISSLLATLRTIPVLLTRLFASLKHWKLSKSRQIFKFVAYFNGKLHACEKFWSQMSSLSAKSLVNKTGIIPRVAKSDEIGKIETSRETSLSTLFKLKSEKYSII